MTWVVAGIACSSALAALAVFVGARLRPYWSSRGRRGPDSPSFCLERYEPMMRLLRDEDLEFLQSQPGYRPEIGTRLKRQRRRLFRLYLAGLAGDFRALHAEARELAANSDAQHADFVGLLLRQEFTFWRAILLIEWRLLAGDTRFAGADVRGLIDALEAMRLQLHQSSAQAV